MNIIETTIEFEGYPIKIRNGKVFLPSFGTTITNHSMHWSYVEVPKDKLSDKLKKVLKQNNLI